MTMRQSSDCPIRDGTRPFASVGRAEGLPALRIRQCDQSRMPRLETRLRAIHGPHFSVHRMLLGLWDRHRRVATGLASGGRPAALRVTDDTARHLRYTSRAKREADASLSHRCTMEHPVAPWSTTMRRVLLPRDRR